MKLACRQFNCKSITVHHFQVQGTYKQHRTAEVLQLRHPCSVLLQEFDFGPPDFAGASLLFPPFFSTPLPHSPPHPGQRLHCSFSAIFANIFHRIVCKQLLIRSQSTVCQWRLPRFVTRPPCSTPEAGLLNLILSTTSEAFHSLKTRRIGVETQREHNSRMFTQKASSGSGKGEREEHKQ